MERGCKIEHVHLFMHITNDKLMNDFYFWLNNIIDNINKQ